MAYAQSNIYQPREQTSASPLLHSSRPNFSLPKVHSVRYPSRHDAYDLGSHAVSSPLMSRTASNASDRFSTPSAVTSHFPATPQNVHPTPAYVAPFGAAQVVGEHQAAIKRFSSDDEDAMPTTNDLHFSTPALALVNAFLDQLLYSFLSVARSTTLNALRPAVTEVLKHRLARDAVASAEEELHELLAGGEEEEEEMNTKQNATESNRKWDLELVWKRTRLRVMVYMRLGEMEDDDEERYVREEDLFHGNERRFSQSTGLVSWAAAIFLTSVLEFVAERTLQVAGQAAYTRARQQSRTQRLVTADAQAPVIVEEYDVEKVALNSTLGRLWRTWRKSLRNAAASLAASHRIALSSLSNDNMSSSMSRPSSVGSAPDGSVDGDPGRQMPPDEVPEGEYPEHVLAANIPLPMAESRRDVDEIEVPGLAKDPDADEAEEVETPIARRSSFTGPATYSSVGGLPTPESTSPVVANGMPEKVSSHRIRSSSVPTPARVLMLTEDKHVTPGSFPEDSTDEGQEMLENNADPEIEPEAGHVQEPDHKFNAEEMAQHKRSSVDVKTLLDRVSNGALPDETAAQKTQNENPSLVGSAVAGASAAVAAAAAVLYGSKVHEHSQEDEGEPSHEARDVEELDRRKSLMDMKPFIAPTKGQSSRTQKTTEIPDTREVVAINQPEAPPTMPSADSDHSNESYTLGEAHDEQMPQRAPAKRQHMEKKNNETTEKSIGVARTSDAAVTNPVTTPSAEKQEARDPSKRLTRLVLGETLPKADSPTAKTESLKTPQEFLASRSLAQPRKDPYPDRSSSKQAPPNEHTRTSEKRVQKPKSVPGVALTGNASQSPLVETSSHRQSWSAAIEKQHQQQQALQDGNRPPSIPTPTPAMPAAPSQSLQHGPQEAPPVPPKSSGAGAQVQEHPVVQRMASLKRSSNKPEADVDNAAALTSSSIKGPEDFDMLVQGADTVKYTLTPEAVRTEPIVQNNEPYRKPVPSGELSSVPSQKRPAPPPAAEASDTRTGRSLVSKQATSASATPPVLSRSQSDTDNRRSISRPPARNLSTHRRSGLLAREPRVMTESTRDFADFIRSTGPSKDQEVQRLANVANRSTTSLHSVTPAQTNGSGSRLSSPGGERTKTLSKSAMEAENIPPVPPMPRNDKSVMQPRTATASASANSELIDFIRSGPEQDGQHRISRTVAPFRSTMDSDQLKDLGDRINGDQPLDLRLNASVSPVSSQPSASTSKPTVHRDSAKARSTTHSSTANATKHPAHSGQPQSLSASSKNMLAPSGEPVRKRHRNKDPYAIDTTDDEDEDLLTALPKNRRQEESLMDFLNNTEPPKNNAPRPIMNGTTTRPPSMVNKAGAGSINTQRSAAAETAGRSRSLQKTTAPRSGDPPSARSLQSDNSTRTTATPPTQKPKMEARSPGDGTKDRESARPGDFRSATDDLADFLKSSGPEDPNSAPAPIVGRRDKLPPKDMERERKKMGNSKRGGFFSRGSKRRTWLDMP